MARINSSVVTQVTLCVMSFSGLANHGAAQEVADSVQQTSHNYGEIVPACGHLGELEELAVDIARRTVLAHHPHSAKKPIYTVEVRVRPQGDLVHTYARLLSYTHPLKPNKIAEAEVFASLIYTPDIRRMIDLSYKHNREVPGRLHNRTSDIVTMYNRELDRRDPLRMPHPLVGPRMDRLAPRSHGWIWSPFQGDHGWHAYNADDRVDPNWLP